MNAAVIDGLSDIADRYDHFILDIFGVVHDGIRPFPGTIDALSNLKAEGKQICLLSNSPRRAQGAVAHMEYMGIRRSLYDHIVTSGEATFLALQNRDDDFHRACGRDCLFIGTPDVNEIVYGLDLNLVRDPAKASFILNSIPGTSPSAVKKMHEMFTTTIARNVPMICANPDLVVHVGDELYECAGTFAKMYEEMGGKVLYHGKPHLPVYERCHALLGHPAKSKIVAVGDSLHTDIAGAGNFGIASALNLAGIHREETGGEAPDSAGIERLLKGQSRRPTYIMSGFQW